MLRGLTERPNVVSTLILSRRDGSIIRATGVDTPEERGSSASGKSFPWSPHQPPTDGQEIAGRGGSSTVDKVDESTDARQPMKPVEVLAGSIFQFVHNANVLGETLETASRAGGRADGAFAASGYGEDQDGPKKERAFEHDTEHNSSADEVQLLRLRTKHQEIIIFPDANYICCVVQKVGKTSASHDRR